MDPSGKGYERGGRKDFGGNAAFRLQSRSNGPDKDIAEYPPLFGGNLSDGDDMLGTVGSYLIPGSKKRSSSKREGTAYRIPCSPVD